MNPLAESEKHYAGVDALVNRPRTNMVYPADEFGALLARRRCLTVSRMVELRVIMFLQVTRVRQAAEV